MARQLGPTHTHTMLVRRMVRATGHAMSIGEDNRPALSQDSWDETVERCRGCSHVGACQSWLEHVELGGEVAEAAPDFCRNAPRFEHWPQAE